MTTSPVALVVHSECAARTMISEALLALGVQTLESDWGIDLAQATHPDLVFICADLLDEAQGEELRQLQTTVILLLRSPIDEVLAEPVTLDQVQDVAGRLLGM